MKKKPRVLFLCTHNAARSQIAEALLRKYAGHRFEAISAGLEPTDVHPLTRQVLEEIGVDHGPLRAKGAREFLGRTSVRYAIIVCQRVEPNAPRCFRLRSAHSTGTSTTRQNHKGPQSSSLRSFVACETRSRPASRPGCATRRSRSSSKADAHRAAVSPAVFGRRRRALRTGGLVVRRWVQDHFAPPPFARPAPLAAG
jgi:protein-tyrosine-phosphatase